jgi:mortality factor 4-like protein 1
LAGGTSIDADEAAANRKRKADEDAETLRQHVLLSDIPPQLRLRIPATLKQIILDDYDRVTQQGLALPLPRSAHGSPVVADIVREWREGKAGQEGVDVAAVDAVAAGLVSYFDNALRQCLLYSCEVPLYEAAVTGDVAPSEVYGAEHLARLCVKLPELVPVVFMAAHGDACNVLTVEAHLHEVMGLLAGEEVRGRLVGGEAGCVKNPHWVAPAVVVPPSVVVPQAAQKEEAVKTEGVAVQ